MAQDSAKISGAETALNPESIAVLPKKLVVCCDGTWMDSDNGWVKDGWSGKGHLQTPTNVTRIARLIASEDDHHHPQIVYYQAGIGTGLGLYSHLVGGGTGVGLAENIREAYAFIANNYRENDPGVPADAIFLIGFSRGAFTARSIGGLIGALGVLKKPAMQYFYEIFQDWENAGSKSYTPLFFDGYLKTNKGAQNVKPDPALAKDSTKVDVYMKEYFKGLKALGLSQAVKINCIGVWDTVGALGIPVNPLLQRVLPFLPSFFHEYSWFDTGLDNHVNHAFQALGLNEHRFPFSPTLWERTGDCKTSLKQVWFPGVHSNVGGSYSDSGIADITLAWMMDQLSGNTTEHPDGFVNHDWIKFDQEYMNTWLNSDHRVAETQKKPEYRGWGMGYLYQSCYFPQSLTGTRTRSPGRYHRTVYTTGKEDPKQLLQGTNEFVHSCVRARIDLDGRDVEQDWSQVFPNSVTIGPWISLFFQKILGRKPPPYKPQSPGGPLEGWRLDDGHASHKEPNLEFDMSAVDKRPVAWHYEGSGMCANKVMPEDKLGPIQRTLLQKDQEYADQILTSTGDLQWVRKGSRKPASGNAHAV